MKLSMTVEADAVTMQALNMGRIAVDIDGIELADLIDVVCDNGYSLRVADEPGRLVVEDPLPSAARLNGTQYAAPTETYRSAVVLQGVLYGYQTMDALAALNFGAVIAMNIRAQGVAREQDVQRSAIRAGFIAGGLLLAVYAMLGHAGALTGAAVPGLATGAEVLTVLAERLFGKAGLVLLAAIFMLACFNTCVGLIACVGEYFHTLLPHIPYPVLAAFFAAASMLIANLGLAEILRLSVPVLNALYPVAIVLITLSFVPGLEQRHRVYPLCIGCTAVQSIAAALPLGTLSALANALPLAALGFGWVLPAAAGLLAGIFLSCTEK